MAAAKQLTRRAAGPRRLVGA